VRFLFGDIKFHSRVLGGLYKENQSQSPMETSCDAKKKIISEGSICFFLPPKWFDDLGDPLWYDHTFHVLGENGVALAHGVV
jgi:hypothetical protein